MNRKTVCLILLLLAFFATETVFAQTNLERKVHKVKKKETIFGIARQYGITVKELIEVNPEMNTPGFELKKNSYIIIPNPKGNEVAPAKKDEPVKSKPVKEETYEGPVNRPVELGVMLPLHDINGDGRRMVEYYRGILMACDSLKKLGLSVNVHAWNTPEDGDISTVLRDKAAARCDMIIGPLYSKQMAALSDFVAQHDIRLIIPFSINAPELQTNRNIFQIYQSPTYFNKQVVDKFVARFAGYHPVIIDCNDTTSTKGGFTSSLRRQLEQMGITYSITNLKSSDGPFTKSFSTSMPNVVVLNTGRSPELNIAMAKLNSLSVTQPNIKITLFGYTEWLMYTKYQLENFYKFDAYIPTAFHYQPLMSNTLRLQKIYHSNFRQDMMSSLPRFALTGFDHAMFFLQGFHRYGNRFTGGLGTVYDNPVQTPLRFERVGDGGFQNSCLIFMHYLPEQRVETIKF